MQRLNDKTVKNESGIILISFPFAAGVCIAALMRQPFAGALAGSAVAAALICACACSRRRCTPQIALLFFSLGIMCWCSSALAPPPERTSSFGAIADGLRSLLDRIPFEGEHSGAIVKALLTGQRSGLPRETVSAFRKSGASHILALSGLHLGVIYACIRRLLVPAGNSPAARALRGCITVGLCGLYALATGASPSITRAFLFICINEAGRSLSGRRHSPAGTFCMALTVQLAIQPDMISSAGFQLSYLAMLGITVLFPRLEAWYPESGRADPLRAVWKSVAMSLSCQLFTAPVAWIRFHSFPAYFLLTNLLALPLSELVIISAVAAAALEATFGCPPALALACGELVQLLEFCLETIASLP